MRLGPAFFILVVAACSPPGGAGNTGGGSGGAGGGSAVGGGNATGGGSGTGGGTSATGGGAATADELPCDVGSIVKSQCVECHASPPLYGAPMPLVTWADMQADSPLFPGQKIHQRMAARVGQTVKPMPQPPRMLTQGQISALQAWSMAGAPKGSGMCGAGGGSGGSAGAGGAGGSGGGGVEAPGCAPGQTKIDIVAPQFDIPQNADFYQCFAQTVSLPAKRHAIKIDKVIDDARVLHHVVLFRDTQGNAKPSEANCGIEADWQALYAWGPGAGPMIPPPDVGLPINNGDQLVIQIHYNNAASVVGKDSSGAYLCVTDQLKTNEAGVLAIGPTEFSLPPNCPATSVQGDCENPSFLNLNFNVFTVWPHMHVRGRALKSTLKRSGQADLVVTDRPVYDFGSQYLEPANFQFRPGDRLTTRCTWDTTGATGPIPWGEETSREMCFNFLYLYPVPPVPFCPPTNTTTAGCP